MVYSVLFSFWDSRVGFELAFDIPNISHSITTYNFAIPHFRHHHIVSASSFWSFGTSTMFAVRAL